MNSAGLARLAVLLAAGLCASCSKSNEAGTAAASGEPRPVSIARAQMTPMERRLPATGWLAAREQTTLSVKVAGRLKSVNVDLGSVIEAGQPLAQVEPRDYELRLQQAAAALAQARAALGLPLEGDDDRVDAAEVPVVRQARAVLDEAARNRERVRNLAREGISSPSELDSAEAACTVARERHELALHEVRMLQATLAQRRAEYDLARQQLADTIVRAPFAGAVQARLANLGEYLPAGSPVLTVVQTDPLRLRLEVPERDAFVVRTGQPIRLRIEGDTNLYTGAVARISPALSDENRMLVLEADVPNRNQLRPGLFARAEIIVNPNEPALTVPENSLIVFAGLEKVVAVENGQAQEKPIRTGRRANGWVEVLSGLQAGEAVILDPGGVRTGQRVTPVERPETAAKET